MSLTVPPSFSTTKGKEGRNLGGGGKPAHSTASSGRSHLAAAIKRCLVYFLVLVMSANISFVGFVINKSFVILL